MCGIAGLVGVSGEVENYAQRLLAAVRHRGPDDEGIERPAPSVTLVHTRLAILDVSAARQWGRIASDICAGCLPSRSTTRRSRRFFSARDRPGIKPLYYSRPPAGGFVFASEVGALLALGR